MNWGNIVGGALAGGGIGALLGYSTSQQQDAQSQAAQLQAGSAQAGIDENRRQFDAIQALMKPFVSAGTGAVGQQQDLLGLNGNDAQQAVISALQSSPAFTSQLKQGENSILANASATGGLRGGNTQAALAQYSPQLLSQLIQQQYSNLGGLTSVGQNAAAMTGNAGMQSAGNVSNLLQQQGAAQAGGVLSNARTEANFLNTPLQMLGGLAGFMGGKF